jgi:hypothetical protein
MSYSLNTKCFTCKKNDKCVDPVVLQNSINTLHALSSDKGHLGGGSIDLNCSNSEQKEEKKPV